MILQNLRRALTATAFGLVMATSAHSISISPATGSERTAVAAVPAESVLSLREAHEREGASALSDVSELARKRKRQQAPATLPADSLMPDGEASELSDPDSLQAPVDTVRLRQVTDSVGAQAGKPKLPKPQFVPDPKRALWLSLVLPGAGQIYNRKYWKLPFIYGGFLGCAYALMWNQQMYRDYSQAYLDIMDDDPDTHSYLDMLPPRYDITGREEQFQNLFKRKKDYYRRYRDLSAFCFIGVYLISVIDAYVDAQLSVFDISPDLTMRVEPAVIGTPGTAGGKNRAAYGVGCSFSF